MMMHPRNPWSNNYRTEEWVFRYEPKKHSVNAYHESGGKVPICTVGVGLGGQAFGREIARLLNGAASQPLAQREEMTTPEQARRRGAAAVTGLLSGDDYTYADIDEYEEITGITVNEAFRIGWTMARATNKQLRAL